MKSTVNIPPQTTSIVRIAPICNGRIYVVSHPSEDGKIRMDLPIEETIEQTSIPSVRTIHKIKGKYNRHISSSASPRFCVQYRSEFHHGSPVYLYILPLKKESDIHFLNGTFVNSEEIASEQKKYSSNLQKEGELLGMAAELWADYLNKE